MVVSHAHALQVQTFFKHNVTQCLSDWEWVGEPHLDTDSQATVSTSSAELDAQYLCTHWLSGLKSIKMGVRYCLSIGHPTQFNGRRPCLPYLPHCEIPDLGHSKGFRQDGRHHHNKEGAGAAAAAAAHDRYAVQCTRAFMMVTGRLPVGPRGPGIHGVPKSLTSAETGRGVHGCGMSGGGAAGCPTSH